VINAHAELTELLGDIPFTTFKGYASVYYYPQPIYRPKGDVAAGQTTAIGYNNEAYRTEKSIKRVDNRTE
jgi:hypothetical protein